MRKNTIKDFWKKVDVRGPNDCWEWKASSWGHCGKHKRAYGCFSWQGKTYSAHRWIYQYINDKKLSKDIVVCHSCDNPKCVNPDHLFEGSQLENVKDRDFKGRFVDHWNQ